MSVITVVKVPNLDSPGRSELTPRSTEHSYFQPYESPRHHHESDRDTKRVRLSPFSDQYESGSSDGECARSMGSLSDYPRSPQLSVHSGQNSSRTSPVLGGYSPNLAHSHGNSLSPLTHHPNSGRPRSSSYNNHLMAGFPGPVKKPRKNRRKLAPLEREQVHQLRKMGACTRCWGLKMKCDNGNPCHRCEKLGAGALCVRVHFVDLDVFSRCMHPHTLIYSFPNLEVIRAGGFILSNNDASRPQMGQHSRADYNSLP